MKTKYILLSLCVFCSALCFGQQKLFDKYADESGVTSVYISKAMFDMMAPLVESSGLQLANMGSKIDGLQILTTDKQDMAERMRKDFSSIVGKNHEELMRVRSDDTKANFYIQKKGEKISEMLMVADSKDTFVIIQLLGDFTITDIRQITSEMEKSMK